MVHKEQVLLSLKNIYRLLTKDDYPSFSAPVISRSERRGLTLTSFWQEVLAPSVSVAPGGEELWQTENKRNRYLSDLFNRSRITTFRLEYFQAVEEHLGPNMVLDIVQRMTAFLRRTGYDAAALSARFALFIPLLQAQDINVTPAIHAYLAELLWLEGEFAFDSGRRLFFDAYMLTMLSLHAFFGMKMNNGAMARLRHDPATSPQALLTVYQGRFMGAAFPPPEQMTNRSSLLCRPPKEGKQFLGRDKELEELTQRIISGGKIMLAGLGGIGKTELLRQVLHGLLGKGIFSRIAYVQYEGSLKESFSQAFLDLHGEELDARYAQCLDRLNDQATGRSLLLIDNLNTPQSKDPDIAALLTLGCDVVLTSRLMAIDSFHVMHIQAPDAVSARGIFQNAYDRPIEPHEEPILESMLRDVLGHHTLLCILAGRMARARHMDITTLSKSLEEEGLKGQFVHHGEQVDLTQIVRFLFRTNQLNAHQQRCLRLFALLPQRVYSFPSCVRLLADVEACPKALADMLQVLSYQGWLQEDGDGYVMHPVVSEAVLESPPALKEFPLFWALVAEKLDRENFIDWQFVDIAHSALIKSDTLCEEAKEPILLAISLYCEQDRMSLRIDPLLTRAAALLKEPALASPAFEYGYYTVHLNYAEMMGITKGVPDIIRQVLALEPDQRDNQRHMDGLGMALNSAFSLGMEKERRAIFKILLDIDLTGVADIKRCLTLSKHYGIKLKHYAEAITWGERGLQAAQGMGTRGLFYLTRLYVMMLSAYAGMGDIENAQAYHDKLLLAVRAWTGGLHTSAQYEATFIMGLAYFNNQDYEKALAHYLQCQSILAALNPSENQPMISLLGNIATTYHGLKDFDKALDFSQQALHMRLRMSQEPNLDIALMKNNLGTIFHDAGRTEQALQLLEEARDLGQSLAGKEQLYYAEPCFNLGRIHLKNKDRSKAVACFEEALPVFEATYGKDHRRTALLRETLQEALA